MIQKIKGAAINTVSVANNAANKAVLSTNGKKTTTTAIIMLLVSIFGDKVPLLKDNALLIDQVLDWILASGLLHKFWRNRKEIFRYIKSKFKKQKL